jgi:hypothetical protein
MASSRDKRRNEEASLACASSIASPLFASAKPPRPTRLFEARTLLAKSYEIEKSKPRNLRTVRKMRTTPGKGTEY